MLPLESIVSFVVLNLVRLLKVPYLVRHSLNGLIALLDGFQALEDYRGSLFLVAKYLKDLNLHA